MLALLTLTVVLHTYSNQFIIVMTIWVEKILRLVGSELPVHRHWQRMIIGLPPPVAVKREREGGKEGEGGREGGRGEGGGARMRRDEDRKYS